MEIKAYAKINLTLDILGKRSDNYHEVEMILQSVDLFDTISISKNSLNQITINSNNNQIPLNEKNLAHKAARLFFEKLDINEGIDIFIEKNIPMAAGLAGGSTDAAATLLLLNQIYNNKLSKEELLKIAENLGSDVPFCLIKGTYLATGRGEKLHKLNDLPKCYILIVTPNIEVSTKDIYDEFDNYISTNTNLSSSILVDALNKNKDIKEISKNIFNVFEPLLLSKHAILNDIKNIFDSCNCLNSCLSGSGPSYYGIFDNLKDTKICQTEILNLSDNIFSYISQPIFN